MTHDETFIEYLADKAETADESAYILAQGDVDTWACILEHQDED